MRDPLFFLCLLAAACGGKLADDTSYDSGACDGAACLDASSKPDAAIHLDAQPDVPSGPCTLGPNTQYGTSECSGDQVDWFATPYTPPSDVTVTRIEAYMAQGHVAILSSNSSMPGTPLFVGSVGTSSTKTWLGADVSPPLSLSGGILYYIGFQGDCSFAAGGDEPIEYMAPSVDEPWHDQGSDNWTARLIGTCP